MKNTIIITLLSFVILSFCNSKTLTQSKEYTIAYINESIIQQANNTTEKTTNQFVGVFPKKNDTVKIFQLEKKGLELKNQYSFWSKKDLKNNSITFYNSDGEKMKVTFKEGKIYVDNDIYETNEAYFTFLKQKILNESSLLDAAFFLKDGYGDYANFLQLLNKNWRNQKENTDFKIIRATVKNKNEQTDDQFFNHIINYSYDKNGKLLTISGEERFTKKYLKEDSKYINYSVENGESERSFSKSILYKNKKTLFDSIVGSSEQFSTSNVTYYTRYQSKLLLKETDLKPKDMTEIIHILKLK